MARIAILTCSNCTQDSNCASVVCLGDMRKRRGFFEPYPKDEPLDLIGIINCAGCPTLAAPEKILKRSGRWPNSAWTPCTVLLYGDPYVPYQSLCGIDKREFPGINIVMERITGGSRPLQTGSKSCRARPWPAPNHE